MKVVKGPDKREFGASFISVLIVVILTAMPVFAQAGPAASIADEAAVKQWLDADGIRLKSVQAGNGFADLRPLKKVLANARIVALGEATHGTREFFQFKHRMVEFLVKEMGFRTFAIEASYPACLNINDYVMYGKGDRAKALASQGFWTWDTNEVSDMLDWMRSYNSSVSDSEKVRFMGFDFQNYSQAFDVIRNYLAKVAPEYTEIANKGFKPLEGDAAHYMGSSDENKQAARTSMLELVGFLSLNEARFVRETSRDEFDIVLQHARVLEEFADSYGRPIYDPKNPQGSGGAYRDRYMAENIEWLLNQPASRGKLILWAHNGHISFGGYSAIKSMGQYLKDTFGPAYYALGFSFYQGSFQSREMGGSMPAGPLRAFTLGPAPQGDVGWFLHQAGIGNFVIDLHSAPSNGPVADWLSTPHPMVSVGSGFSESWKPEQYRAPTILKDHYDGLIFIDTTSRARPNPTGVRPLPGEAGKDAAKSNS